MHCPGHNFSIPSFSIITGSADFNHTTIPRLSNLPVASQKEKFIIILFYLKKKGGGSKKAQNHPSIITPAIIIITPHQPLHTQTLLSDRSDPASPETNQPTHHAPFLSSFHTSTVSYLRQTRYAISGLERPSKEDSRSRSFRHLQASGQSTKQTNLMIGLATHSFITHSLTHSINYFPSPTSKKRSSPTSTQPKRTTISLSKPTYACMYEWSVPSVRPSVRTGYKSKVRPTQCNPNPHPI